MKYDKQFLICALIFAAVGLALGIYMAATDNHGQLVTHAHILMIGFVFSLAYAVIHRLWLDNPSRSLASTQFLLHQATAIAISIGLFLLFGGLVPAATLGPVLGIVSTGVLLSLLLMLYMVVKFGKRTSAAS